MKIRRVVVGPFKKHAEPVAYDFGENATGIYGTNNVGKTTIKAAVAFCFYGCDLKGNDRLLEDLYPNEHKAEFYKIPAGLEKTFSEWRAGKGGKNYISQLEAFRKQHNLQAQQPTAEVTVIGTLADGQEHTIMRKRTFKGTTTIRIDGIKSTPAQLAAALPPKELFLSIFLTGYYLETKEEKQQDLLRSYLPQVSWKEMLASTVQECPARDQVSRYETLEQAVEFSKTAHLSLASDVSQLEQKRDILASSLNDMAAGNLQASVKQAEEMVLAAKEQADRIASILTEQKRRAGINAERASSNASLAEAARSARETNEYTARRRDEIAKRLAEIGIPIEPADDSIMLKKEYDAIAIADPVLPSAPSPIEVELKQVPALGTLVKCPLCNGDLEAFVSEQVGLVAEENERRKAAVERQHQGALELWRSACARVTSEVTAQNRELIEKKEKIGWEVQKASEKYNDDLRTYHRLLSEKEGLEREVATLRDVAIPEMQDMLPQPELPWASMEEGAKELENARTDLENRQRMLNEEHRKAGEAEQLRNARAKTEKELNDVKARLAAKAAQLGEMAMVRKGVENLPGLVLREQMKAVAELVPDVDITFFREIKATGEFKPALEFYFRGVPYGMLSNSHRIMLSVDLGALLNALSGVNVPIFVDNGESIVQLPRSLQRQQYLVAYVDKRYQQLTLSTQ